MCSSPAQSLAPLFVSTEVNLLRESLTVFIPVYNGGEWFRECLESIAKHKTCFRRLIVSVNKGESQQQDVVSIQDFARRVPELDVTVIVQKRKYSAGMHGKVLWWQLRKVHLDGYIMMLAHDDVLLDNFSEVMSKAQEWMQESVVINPAKSFFRENFSKANEEISYYGTKVFSRGIPVDEFVSLDFDRYYITNMSAMICHHTVFGRASTSCLYLLHGYRAEYMFLTASGVDRIVGTDAPIVGIRLHGGQQGGMHRPALRAWDETMYLIHCLRRTQDTLLKKKIIQRSRWLRFFSNPPLFCMHIAKRLYQKCLHCGGK